MAGLPRQESAAPMIVIVPNTAARTLKMRSSQAVAVITVGRRSCSFEDPNIGAIMLAANAALSLAPTNQMVNLIVEPTRNTQRVARYLSGGFVGGAITVSTRASDRIVTAIRDL